jgi:hypothetical protein
MFTSLAPDTSIIYPSSVFPLKCCVVPWPRPQTSAACAQVLVPHSEPIFPLSRWSSQSLPYRVCCDEGTTLTQSFGTLPGCHMLSMGLQFRPCPAFLSHEIRTCPKQRVPCEGCRTPCSTQRSTAFSDPRGGSETVWRGLLVRHRRPTTMGWGPGTSSFFSEAPGMEPNPGREQTKSGW